MLNGVKLNTESLKTGSLFAALIAVAFGIQALIKTNYSTHEIPKEVSHYIGTSVDPKIIQRLLGLKLLGADLIWIDTMIKADIAKEAQPFSAFFQSFKNIILLDPDNIYAYYVGGLYLSVIKDDIKGASAILRLGSDYLKQHPVENKTAWNVPYLLGYNLIFEEHEFEEGAKYVLEAASYPHVPRLIKQLAARVSTRHGQLELASRILADLRSKLTNVDQRKEVEKKMLKVAVELELLDLNEAFEKYRMSTGAFAFKKARQLEMFLRSMNHGVYDLTGKRLTLDRFGKIVSESIK